MLNGKPADSVGDFQRQMQPAVIGRLKHNLALLDNVDEDDDDDIQEQVLFNFKECVM